MGVSSIRPTLWGLLRGERWSGALLMAGFVVQSVVLVASSERPLGMLGVVGLLTLLQAALVGLWQIWLALRGREEAEPIPRGWKWALAAGAALYLAHILLLPALIPHDASFHDTIRYRAGLPGLLFYLSAGCAVLLARLLLLPFALAILLGAALHRRALPPREALWPALAAASLLLLALTWQQAAEYAVWWMD
ncbi:MAG TPA: hypothetical protein VFS21_19720 [Roseiflexaceae bacterium]|nr:hypothetical protein [Roseiflexaceae bacterium]